VLGLYCGSFGDWQDYRDDDKNSIVQVNHSNDDFDHLPVYDIGMPVEDPHVNMMLLFQMEVLSELAGKTGNRKMAEYWDQQCLPGPEGGGKKGQVVT